MTLPFEQARRPEAAAGRLLLLLYAVLAICRVAACCALRGLCPALGRYPLPTSRRDGIAAVTPYLLLLLLLLLVTMLVLLLLYPRPTLCLWG
jgi:hypothetical protein